MFKLSLLCLITFGLLYFYILTKLNEYGSVTRKRIDDYIVVGKFNTQENVKKAKTKFSFSVLTKPLKTMLGKDMTYSKEMLIDKKLIKAGRPLGMSALDFQVFKYIVRFGTPVIFTLYAKMLNLPLTDIILVSAFGLLLGLILPNHYLKTKTRKRQKQALRELPDFLDILTVCLEAGLGFDSALVKVTNTKTGVVCNEFKLFMNEVRLGKSRKEGLLGIRERLDFDELRSLINSILQSEKLGTSLVNTLSIRSKEAREERKQRAEEEAMKAPIKILFPIVIFIFPSMFIVILAPTVIRFIQQMHG